MPEPLLTISHQGADVVAVKRRENDWNAEFVAAQTICSVNVHPVFVNRAERKDMTGGRRNVRTTSDYMDRMSEKLYVNRMSKKLPKQNNGG